MGRVLVVGSLNVDLVTKVERHPRSGETVRGEGMERFAGGKGANQAVAAAQAGAHVALIGCIGSDEDGRNYVQRLAARGIDVNGVATVRGPTGHALIVVDEDGENTIVAVPGANALLTSAALAPLRGLQPGDVVVLQLEIPLDVVAAAARLAHGAGARVVLNLAPYAALDPDVVALADPVVVNEHEAMALADSDTFGSSLLVTLGAAGANWDGLSVTASALAPQDIRDTTGAGDAFVGALAAALAAGADRHTALLAATTAGSAALRHAGAQPEPRL